jgi:hypothetical protein
MASDYKILGQAAPAATTDTTVYTVPAGTKTVVSTIIIANQAAAAGSFRLTARPDGEALTQKHYMAYDVPIAANESITLTLGLTLDAADIITAYCSSANMSVNLFGAEITT